MGWITVCWLFLSGALLLTTDYATKQDAYGGLWREGWMRHVRKDCCRFGKLFMNHPVRTHSDQSRAHVPSADAVSTQATIHSSQSTDDTSEAWRDFRRVILMRLAAPLHVSELRLRASELVDPPNSKSSTRDAGFSVSLEITIWKVQFRIDGRMGNWELGVRLRFLENTSTTSS